ncbi:Trk system potassium transporter TrkA [Alkalibacter rhizosphaerae]|uniref:Trk system potassium uptake protein TrkA n=1 Tax=Alkalibacter rhizosphaerae TaxID=2815577 RepID=A0A974XH63_9FIRM|nr:Trk system potassium transporter TrkA [Alkalibacter rhizosphaerae]QSX09731.1 Trk system potassium transporter TrkA [Alkalibacter rhizosphaerae]
MIVGGGKLGVRLAATMNNEKMDVTLVDSNQSVIDKVNEHLDVLTVVASGINVSVLKDLNIDKFDLLVACTDNDATNSIICTFSKKLGCKKTIARIRDPEYMEQLDFIRDELGIDLIINPDLATANTIAKYLLKNVIFYAGEFASGRVKMFDFSIGHLKDFVGKRVAELNGLDDLLITAISREGNLIIPDGSTILEPDDVIYVLGMFENIEILSRRFKLRGSEKKVENTMILGGGHVGYYLAKELAKSKINVTLIEQDPKKVQNLAELLDHVLVIEGDGTDLTLLEEENIEKMDAFIGVTGFDEQNLLMALMAKQAGVNKTIAKVSRQNYTHVIDKLAIDVAINPINITASNILKFVRGGKVASVSLLLGGKGEVTEIIATPDMPYIGKPIYKLHLPKGVIIGTVIRDKEIIIPNGNTIIEANDRLVVFTLAENIDSLKQLFKRGKGGILGELWNRSKNPGFDSDY